MSTNNFVDIGAQKGGARPQVGFRDDIDNRQYRNRGQGQSAGPKGRQNRQRSRSNSRGRQGGQHRSFGRNQTPYAAPNNQYRSAPIGVNQQGQSDPMIIRAITKLRMLHQESTIEEMRTVSNMLGDASAYSPFHRSELMRGLSFSKIIPVFDPSVIVTPPMAPFVGLIADRQLFDVGLCNLTRSEILVQISSGPMGHVLRPRLQMPAPTGPVHEKITASELRSYFDPALAVNHSPKDIDSDDDQEPILLKAESIQKKMKPEPSNVFSETTPSL